MDLKKINVTKRIVNLNVSSMLLLCSEEYADFRFQFRCYDDEENEIVITLDDSVNDETDSGRTRNWNLKTIPVHKVVLAAGSPVFKQMFYGPLKESESVKIVDVSISAFTEFLQFFYSAEPLLTWENASEVVYCGDKYQVPHVVEAYKKFLKIDVLNEFNACSVLKIALRFQFSHLKAECEDVIQRCMMDIINYIDFVRCDRAILKHILSMENLNTSECDLFAACIRWAMEQQKLSVDRKKFSSKNLKDWLGDCWDLIRFPTMKITEFAEITYRYSKFFEKDEILDILDAIIFTAPLRKYKYETFPRRTVNSDDD